MLAIKVAGEQVSRTAARTQPHNDCTLDGNKSIWLDSSSTATDAYDCGDFWIGQWLTATKVDWTAIACLVNPAHTSARRSHNPNPVHAVRAFSHPDAHSASYARPPKDLRGPVSLVGQ